MPPPPRAFLSLLHFIPLTVAASPVRGCTRSELAAELGVAEYDDGFIRAVWACYRRGEVDLCGRYVVAPPRTASEEK